MQYVDKVVYTFSAANAPIASIDSGEVVIFRTQDCFSNQMHSESQLVTNCDYSKMNPATGPLFVRDAHPGDVLKVELLDVQCDVIGTTTLPKIGPLWDKCETRTKRIPIENGKAVFNDVRFPVNPMIGVIGVAPEEGKSVPCGYPGNHGGNLDCKLMVKGNTAYFPVRVEGALVQMGDMHAVMGDSELCGTGLEINGTVMARISIIRQCALDWPVLETPTSWYTLASARIIRKPCAMPACRCSVWWRPPPAGTRRTRICTCPCAAIWKSVRPASPAKWTSSCASACPRRT